MRVGDVSYFAEELTGDEGVFGNESLFGLGAAATFAGRVEVTTADGSRYIPGAAVTLLRGFLDKYFDDGDKRLSTVLTDAGGNAAFLNISTELPGENFWYKVSAPGYVTQFVIANPGSVQRIALDAAPAAGGVPVVAIVGGVAVLGILGYMFFKK